MFLSFFSVIFVTLSPKPKQLVIFVILFYYLNLNSLFCTSWLDFFSGNVQLREVMYWPFNQSVCSIYKLNTQQPHLAISNLIRIPLIRSTILWNKTLNVGEVLGHHVFFVAFKKLFCTLCTLKGVSYSQDNLLFLTCSFHCLKNAWYRTKNTEYLIPIFVLSG